MCDGQSTQIRHGAGFVEVGDRCWVARYEYLDVNVGVVAGERGLLLVDTNASEPDARVVVEHLRRLGRGPVVAVVNTHDHFDHSFGNAVLAEEYDGPELIAHEAAAEALAVAGPAMQDRARGDDSEPRHRDVAAARILVPGSTFSSARVVDLGDRIVELVHPGRGHTAGDVVVGVPDADVVFAGDLVEESALREGVPGFGEDCYPLEWPGSLELVLGMLTERSVVVPGHGVPVDRGFVQEQQHAIGAVAQTISDLAARGVRPEAMAEAAEWPFPVEELRHAFSRGYAALPRASRSLPLA